MVKLAYVRVKGELIRCRISPKTLEKDYKRNHRTFKTNGLRLLSKLSRAYGLFYVRKFSRIKHLNYKVRCMITIEGLIDCILGFGQSRRDAMKNAIFKVHRAYCNLIEYKDE